MRLRELLDIDELGLRPLVGADTGDGMLDRAIAAVPTIDRADPGRFLTGGELVLTGLAWWHEDGDAEAFVRVLVRAGVTALAAGEVEHGLVPDDLVRACRRHGLPLLAVRPETSFSAITEHVLRRLHGLHRQNGVGSLAAVVERHRMLLADRSSADLVLDLLRENLGVDVRVLSATGRQISGAQPPLRARTAAALAARYLAARRARQAAPHVVRIGDRPYSLAPVSDVRAVHDLHDVRDAIGRGPHAEELGDWLVVIEADTSYWPGPDAELLDRLVELVTDARSAHEQSKAALRDLAGRALELLHSTVPAEEIPVRLRSTAQSIVSGQLTWPREQFVIASGEWHEGRPVPAAALRVLLEEALLQPDGPVRVSPQDIAGTVDGEQAVLLVLVPEPTPGLPDPSLDCAALQRRLSAALARWLGPTDRVCVGISVPVDEPGNARRALEEARNALRIARAGPERVTVRGPDDLTTHILSLLPLIPADTRRAFADRLLGPLRDHDRRHRTDLLTTLRTFLDCDASWTACAARLHLHTNSLRHRVTRIEQLTGRDLSRLETRLDFLAALRSG
ncbi:PucR family transcriptional regulator ligand-binding domain-containing protein [Streptomyces sp. NPDC048255]|uniref:PucR family transcriptional regulator ligand-binding domain-containing protein n=1 Tax=Streptomyces sp. NPDC048255 TaxID=3154713 RepID=UPI0034012EA2